MNDQPSPSNLPAPETEPTAARGELLTMNEPGSLTSPPAFSPLTQIPLALFAAMLLDVTDVFGEFLPVGLVTGLFIGAPLAWFAAKSFGLSQRVRLGAAVAGFVYCIVPGTAVIPAATGVAIIESLVKVIRPSR